MFDDSGKFLFKFGDGDGEEKMYYPRGLTINGDIVLISNGEFLTKSTHCILIYQLNGTFISKIGKFGKGEAEFNYPCGLTYNSSHGDLHL